MNKEEFTKFMLEMGYEIPVEGLLKVLRPGITQPKITRPLNRPGRKISREDWIEVGRLLSTKKGVQINMETIDENGEKTQVSLNKKEI